MPIEHVILLGLIEGLTEFIPVSSTGHLLLAGHFLGFHSQGKAFEVMIQLGAVLAIITIYFWRLLNVVLRIPHDPAARQFVLSILVAFLPAAVIGVAAHGFIKTVLFESPALICSTLVLGGVVLLAIDRLALAPVHTEAMAYPLPLAFKIGICQCVAMIPGVSRSGATIAGALLLGTDKRSAAEFSFFLAIPTMAGAFTYDLYKNWSQLSVDELGGIAIGFVVAFIAGAIVVKYLLDFVSRHGFAPFAWWRIIVGLTGFAGLAIYG